MTEEIIKQLFIALALYVRSLHVVRETVKPHGALKASAFYYHHAECYFDIQHAHMPHATVDAVPYLHVSSQATCATCHGGIYDEPQLAGCPWCGKNYLADDAVLVEGSFVCPTCGADDLDDDIALLIEKYHEQCVMEGKW